MPSIARMFWETYFRNSLSIFLFSFSTLSFIIASLYSGYMPQKSFYFSPCTFHRASFSIALIFLLPRNLGGYYKKFSEVLQLQIMPSGTLSSRQCFQRILHGFYILCNMGNAVLAVFFADLYNG